MIICPLCLQEIDPPVDFQVFCRIHKSTSRVIRYSGEPNDLEKFRCIQEDSCNQPLEMWAGVFLAHIGCRVRNPFWDGKSVEAAANRMLLETEGGNLVTVTDPQLELLQELAVLHPDREEMWFPLGLFRALNESETYGKLILLAGPKQVGKTVIATMAMSPHSYNAGPLSEYEPQSFMSLHSMSGAAVALESFLAAIYNASQLQQRSPMGFVAPTGRDDAHMKVVFLAASPQYGLGYRIKTIFKEAITLAISPTPVPRAGQIHPALAFFDFAGERFSRLNSHTLESIMRKMHVVVVIVEAPDLARFSQSYTSLAPTGKESSVSHASKRLNMIPNGVRVCLVITKLDLIPDKLLGTDAVTYLGALDSAEDQKLDDQPRQIFQSWLSPSASDENTLAARMRNRRELPVFFVRTLNLAGSSLGVNGQIPHSIGLQRLLLWILNRLPRK